MIPVILSGGSGTRLWPLSREAYPKQFLPLAGSAVWAILYRHSVRTKACVILVILATGMSISALNNVYAITPIALLAAFSFSSGIAQTGSSTLNYSRMSRQ